MRFESEDEAMFAVQAMNGAMFNNRPLQVSFKTDNKYVNSSPVFHSSSVYFQPLVHLTTTNPPIQSTTTTTTIAKRKSKSKSNKPKPKSKSNPKFMPNNNHQALFFQAHHALNYNPFTII